MNDTARLKKALREVGAKDYQVQMAAILLAVNGIENALEFVYGLPARGLTLLDAQPPPESDAQLALPLS